MRNKLRGLIKQLNKNDGKLVTNELIDYMVDNHGFVHFGRPDNKDDIWAFWEKTETIENEFVTTKCIGFVRERFKDRYNKLVVATLHVKEHNPYSRTVLIDDDFETIWERGE